MKNSIKILLVVACVAIMSVALAACNFLNYPKVAGCTYEYDKTEYDASAFEGNASVLAGLTTRVASIEAAAAREMTFSAEDKTVSYTSLTGTTSYTYKQDGTNIILYDAPNKNSNYEGTVVTGYTITKNSKDVLVWHQTLIYEENSVDVYLYYNIVPATPAE